MVVKEKPYMSFVIIGRNDNYAEGYMYRLQIFINHLVYLCERFKLPAEIIVVEWNPPKENNMLYEELIIPKDRKYVSIRFIEVPNKIHKKLKNSDKIHFFEFIGKNVGIKRAMGDFVLVTNTDIIFNEKMIQTFSERWLKDGVYYRANRYDMPVSIPSSLKMNKVSSFCKANWHHCWSPRFGHYLRKPTLKDFIRIPSRTALKYFSYFSYLRYHGGAPGDFMLLSKKGWNSVRGFPETSFQRGLLDGYTSIQIISDNNKFKILDGTRTYHQYHKISPMCYGKEQEKEYLKDARKMLEEEKAIIENSSDWGLGNYNFKEKVF